MNSLKETLELIDEVARSEELEFEKVIQEAPEPEVEDLHE